MPIDRASTVTYYDPTFAAIVYWGQWEYYFQFRNDEWFMYLHSCGLSCKFEVWTDDPLR